MAFKIVGALAIISIAICLVPGGAHLFESANKMALSPVEYMTVQRIYAGWSLFGFAIFPALLITLVHTVMARGDHPAFALSLIAFVSLAATQAVFWTFTYPMNAATANWTVTPANFEAARRQWEYSHVGSAVLTFVALTAITISVLARKSD
jgi:hypothetical protein